MQQSHSRRITILLGLLTLLVVASRFALLNADVPPCYVPDDIRLHTDDAFNHAGSFPKLRLDYSLSSDTELDIGYLALLRERRDLSLGELVKPGQFLGQEVSLYPLSYLDPPSKAEPDLD
jgi:hypothetical protein